MTPDGRGNSRSSAPGCLPCQGHWAEEQQGGLVHMSDQQSSRPAVPNTATTNTTNHDTGHNSTRDG